MSRPENFPANGSLFGGCPDPAFPASSDAYVKLIGFYCTCVDVISLSLSLRSFTSLVSVSIDSSFFSIENNRSAISSVFLSGLPVSWHSGDTHVIVP